MVITDNMKQLVEDIILSYESRVSTIGAIIDNAYQIIEDFKTQRNIVNNKLKEALAENESLRKKDFDNMVKDILKKQDEREREIKGLMKTYLEEQKNIAGTLKNALINEKAIKISKIKTLMMNIHRWQKEREIEVSNLLKDFQEEQQEMIRSLQSLLDKGEVVRLRDLKEVLKKIQIKQNGQKNRVGRILGKGGEIGIGIGIRNQKMMFG